MRGAAPAGRLPENGASAADAAGSAASWRARDRARHEDEILEVAERLFAANSFEATTMAAVASEAGFAIGTLYNLFGSKEAILEALLARHLAALARATTRAAAEVASPRAKLEATVLARATYCGEHSDFFRVLVLAFPGAQAGTGQGAPPALLRSWQEERSRLEACFHELGGQGLDAATRALVFYAATRAYICERVLKAGRPPRLDEVSALVRALLDGLAGDRTRARE